MDALTSILLSLPGLGLTGILISIIWKNLNVKVSENCKRIVEIEKQVKDEYVTKELYHRDLGSLEKEIKEIKDEMKENIKLTQQLIQDVGLMRVRLEEILNKRG